MKYHDVLKTQEELKVAIEATKSAEGGHGNINSIVKLMALNSPATVPKLEGNNKEAFAIDIIQSQMNDIRHMLEMTMIDGKRGNGKGGGIVAIEYERIVNKLDKLSSTKSLKGLARENAEKDYHKLMMEAEELMMHCDREGDHRMMRYLQEKIHRQMRDKF